jgi:hypothetical protein
MMLVVVVAAVVKLSEEDGEANHSSTAKEVRKCRGRTLRYD